MGDSGVVVEAILRDELGIAAPSWNADLVETGMLDSLALITLVYEIEQRCGVSIPFEGLEVDDFRSINSVAALIERLGGEGSP